MSKDRNTMAKRQREMEKKRKADDKRARRKNKDKLPIQIVDPMADDSSLDQPQSDQTDSNGAPA